jgi:beta-ribofuranosylaminobenzene 5'-phosphate synthase
MSVRCPGRVVVEAPARLHFGFIDLEGAGGRVFGSIGAALEWPQYVVEARPADRPHIDGEPDTELARILAALGDDLRPPGIALRVLQQIPRHRGLGSGTQRDLALAVAIARMAGHCPSGADLSARLGRGRRSGVGVATFDRGGLVVDAGIAQAGGTARAGRPPAPPVIFQRALPEDWHFVLATPPGEAGLHGGAEEAVFRELRPMSAALVGRVSRLVLMEALPAILTDDIGQFGEAITEIQILMGEHFAPYQGGAYATELGRAIAEFARKHGAAGVGQSSWGPTVFALVRGADAAGGLMDGVRRLARDPALALWATRASARGAVVHAHA